MEDPRSELASKKSFFDVVWMTFYNLSISYNCITWKIWHCNTSCKQWWYDEGPLMPCLELTMIHCSKLHNVVLLFEVVQCCTIVWCYVIGARKQMFIAWRHCCLKTNYLWRCTWTCEILLPLICLQKCALVCQDMLALTFLLKIESTNKPFFCAFFIFVNICCNLNNGFNIHILCQIPHQLQCYF